MGVLLPSEARKNMSELTKIEAGDTVTFDVENNQMGNDGEKTANVIETGEVEGADVVWLGADGEKVMYIRDTVISGGDNPDYTLIHKTGKALGDVRSMEVA